MEQIEAVKVFVRQQLSPKCYKILLSPLLEESKEQIGDRLRNTAEALYFAPTQHGSVLDQCRRLLLSRVLSFLVIVGATIVKVPQIVKIVSAQSADGLSLPSFIIDAVCALVTLIYNTRQGHPFTTYGEILFIAVQNSVLVLLVMVLRRQFLGAVGSTIAATALIWWCLVGCSHAEITQYQNLTVPIAVAGRLPQIYRNWVNGSTGQLSALTLMLTVAGNAARIFTTLQEVKDPAILISTLAAAALNGVLLLQLTWYSIFSKKEEEKKKQEKVKKSN